MEVWWAEGATCLCWPQELYRVGDYDSEAGELWGDQGDFAGDEEDVEDEDDTAPHINEDDADDDDDDEYVDVDDDEDDDRDSRGSWESIDSDVQSVFRFVSTVTARVLIRVSIFYRVSSILLLLVLWTKFLTISSFTNLNRIFLLCIYFYSSFSTIFIYIRYLVISNLYQFLTDLIKFSSVFLQFSHSVNAYHFSFLYVTCNCEATYSYTFRQVFDLDVFVLLSRNWGFSDFDHGDLRGKAELFSFVCQIA